MVAPKPAANNDFFFQKVFWDGDFVAAGQLIIPPKKSKPTKGTKDNTFVRIITGLGDPQSIVTPFLQVFYVIEGAVTVKIHRSSFVVANGGMFMVPRGELSSRPIYQYVSAQSFIPTTGNMYFIQNISDRDARLFFAQARKVLDLPEEEVESEAGLGRFSQSQSRSPSRKSSRGPSGRAPSKGRKAAQNE